MALSEIESITFAALFLIPIIVYAVASGRLRELSGPGGIGAKFQEMANAEVDPAPISRDTLQLQLIEKGDIDNLHKMRRTLSGVLPNALVLLCGPSNYYSDHIKQYIRMMETTGTGTYVIFVHPEEGTFVGSAKADQILSIIKSPLANDFVAALHADSNRLLAEFGFINEEYLLSTETNMDAFRKFQKTGADGLIVIDKKGRPSGIVDRKRLITNLLGQVMKTH